MSAHQAKRPFIARTVRVLAIPIIVFWGLVAVTTNTFMPKVEDVAAELAGPMIPTYAPSQVAMLHIGEKFQESTSTSLTMVVLEADRPLDDGDHRYYDDLMQRLKHDTQHVQYVMDLWGKPFSAAGAQSVDGKSTFVLSAPCRRHRPDQANQSVNAVRDIVANDTPPPGLKVYVSGAAPLASDTLSIANSSLNNITIVTIVLIIVMLLLVYRSVSTLLVPLASVLFEMLIAKGVISTLGHFGVIPLSSFAVNIVVALTLGAGTDYGIFLMGRYQEARQLGESREEAYFTAYRGVSPIIIGSGLTIAGAGFCLSFARLDYFHTMGPAVAISHAVHHRGGVDARPGDPDGGQPLRALRSRSGWCAGTCTGGSGPAWCGGRCRFSRPVAPWSCSGRSSCRPTGSTTTTARTSRPTRLANQGFAASDRHFPQSKLFTEMLMVESDHDMRNSADFISLDRVAESLIRLPGVAMVQSITRPLGRPLDRASIPYLFTTQGSGSGQQLPFNQQQNADTDKQAQIQADTVAALGKTIDLTQKLADELHSTVLTLREPASGHRRDQRRHLESRRLHPAAQELLLLGAALFRHPHVLRVPIAVRRARRHRRPRRRRSRNAVTDFQAVDALLPQMIAQLKISVTTPQALQAVIVNSYGPAHLQSTQTDQTFDDLINVGNDFDTSRSDDFFYMPTGGVRQRRRQNRYDS